MKDARNTGDPTSGMPTMDRPQAQRVDRPQSRAVAFREVQRFRQWWIWLLVLGLAALNWYGFIQQIILGQSFGTKPGPDWMIGLLWLLFGIGFPWFFLRLRLIVEVCEDCVYIRYVPLGTCQIPFTEIERFQVRTYRPIAEYGGWGLKGWSRRRIAYSISGNRGVELELDDGRKIMIGSQKPEHLAQAIALRHQTLRTQPEEGSRDRKDA